MEECQMFRSIKEQLNLVYRSHVMMSRVQSNAVSERSNDFANTVESCFRQSYIEQEEIFFRWRACVLGVVVRGEGTCPCGAFVLLCYRVYDIILIRCTCAIHVNFSAAVLQLLSAASH